MKKICNEVLTSKKGYIGEKTWRICQKVLKNIQKSNAKINGFLMHFGSQNAPKMEWKSRLFGLLFGKRENVKIAASCRQELQNQGLGGLESHPKSLQKHSRKTLDFETPF